MSGIYRYGSDIVAVYHGAPEHPVLVGTGDDLDEAIESMDLEACGRQAADVGEREAILATYDDHDDEADDALVEIDEDEILALLENAGAEAREWAAEHLGVTIEEP